MDDEGILRYDTNLSGRSSEGGRSRKIQNLCNGNLTADSTGTGSNGYLLLHQWMERVFICQHIHEELRKLDTANRNCKLLRTICNELGNIDGGSGVDHLAGSDHVLITAETSGKWYDGRSGKTINNSNIFNVIKVNRRMQLWKLNRSEWVL